MDADLARDLRGQLEKHKDALAFLLSGRDPAEPASTDGAEGDRALDALTRFWEIASPSDDDDEPYALVGARLRPRTPLRSGSIALPLPHEPEVEDASFPSIEMRWMAGR